MESGTLAVPCVDDGNPAKDLEVLKIKENYRPGRTKIPVAYG